MATILINLSKYILIFLMLFYTLFGFLMMRVKDADKLKKRAVVQNVIMFVIFTICSVTCMYYKWSVNTLVFFLLEFVYLILFIVLYRLIYPDCSIQIVNNMSMLMMLGFVMVERLAPSSAFKQFVIVLIGTVIGFFVPRFMRKRHTIVKMKYLFAVIGILMLGITLVLGKTTWGAQISVDIAGFSFQPSEFVKLIYVLFVAAMLWRARTFGRVVASAAIAALHVLVLVASNDLGTALIFFVVYIVMLYVGTGKIRYLIAGLLDRKSVV